jgi:hypothetical protein
MTVVLESGPIWSEVAKQLKGTRTEHMVKNRYHSLIEKERKKGQNIPSTKLEQRLLNSLRRDLSVNKEETLEQFT